MPLRISYLPLWRPLFCLHEKIVYSAWQIADVECTLEGFICQRGFRHIISEKNQEVVVHLPSDMPRAELSERVQEVVRLGWIEEHHRMRLNCFPRIHVKVVLQLKGRNPKISSHQEIGPEKAIKLSSELELNCTVCKVRGWTHHPPINMCFVWR